MKIEVIKEPISVYGLTIRTKNENEMSQETAKIGNLWHSFTSNGNPQLI